MGRTATWAVVVLAGAVLAGAVPARAAAVRFDVKKGGDVQWKGGCTVDIFPDGGADPVKTGAPAENPVDLDPGRYDAVVACDSDEGPVKKTAPFRVAEADVKVPLALDPGFLLVDVQRFDTPAAAELTVFDERGREVASSKDKAVIPLCPGRVRVLAKVDAKDAGRFVFGNASADITAKKKTTVTVDTTDGELLVKLTDNGKKAGGVVALRQPGQKTRLVELHAGEKGQAPPGVYDLVTQLDDTHDFSEQVTKNVRILPGKLTARTVAHHTGAIKPIVLVDGHAPPKDDKIDVELSTPGAAAPMNTASAGELLKVSPGTFQVSAVDRSAARDDATDARATAKVTVHAGQVKPLTLDIESARLDVVTAAGGKVQPLTVEIRAPGNQVPLTTKESDADGKVSFRLAPGKLTVRGILKAPQGDVMTNHDVSLALGSRLAMKLDVDVGTAVVQVFENGVAVPAEVRFFPSSKVDPKTGPQGEPLLSVPSGQDAYLPPGSYALVVVRSGDTHVFSDLKVASGRTVERTVDVSAAASGSATGK